jgi:tetratricopeptide (TPR) repeat protein
MKKARNKPGPEDGRIRAGLIIFIALLAAVAVRYGYVYFDRASRLTSEAKELMAAGKYDSALKILDEAVAADPREAEAHYHRGLCLAERHRFEEALEAFARVLELDPAEANAAFNRAKIFHYLERCPEVLSEIEKARPHAHRLVDPNQHSIKLLEAECRYRAALEKLAEKQPAEDDVRQAVSVFRDYLKGRPGAPDRQAVEQKIEILTSPEKFPEVLERFRKNKPTQ